MCEKSGEWPEPVEEGGDRWQEKRQSPMEALGLQGEVGWAPPSPKTSPPVPSFDRGGPRSLPEGVCPRFSVTKWASTQWTSLQILRPLLFEVLFPASCKLTPHALVPQCCQRNGARNHTLLLCGGRGWPFPSPHHCVAFALKRPLVLVPPSQCPMSQGIEGKQRGEVTFPDSHSQSVAELSQVS